jgi:hypothetical protein
MYFDHKNFGLTPSFTSTLQLMHGGGRESNWRNNIKHGHLRVRDEGNKGRRYLGKE